MKLLSGIKIIKKEDRICKVSLQYVKRIMRLKDKKEPEPVVPPEQEKEPEPVVPSEEEIYKILLLTNRDSDNVGDQVIEACDISLVSTVMDNLNITKEYFRINSRAGSVISKKYLATKDGQLLTAAKSLIKESDLIIFGGAPVFNYRYQNFYERTAVTLEIAQKYNKPVVFSAIGVDEYDKDSKKCQRLKETLNFDCVKQITTRDDFESLQQFVDNDQIIIGKVSDPAVFTSAVFKKFIAQNSIEGKKKVGIFILRSDGFVNNGTNFSRDEAAVFWESLVCELENKGYEYEILTSGHFGDEAFLDYLIKNRNIDLEKCVFNMNYPEMLVKQISTYDAVISCRLHPSIISYSLGIPALGIVWNSKVSYFYDSIGYKDRIFNVKELDPKDVVERIGQAISEGVNRDEEYLVSVYNALYDGIKRQVCPDKSIEPYSYEELMDKIVPFKGTSKKEKEEKLKRKFRRAYGKYNDIFDKSVQRRKEINKLKSEQGYEVAYNGGVKSDELCWDYDETSGKVQRLGTGSIEYRLNNLVSNDGKTRLVKNGYTYPGYTFVGWRMRIKDDQKWYWYLEDKSYKLQMEYNKKEDKGYYLLKDEEEIPYFRDRSVTTVILEAVWTDEETMAGECG